MSTDFATTQKDTASKTHHAYELPVEEFAHQTTLTGHDKIIALQRNIGNQAVQRMFTEKQTSTASLLSATKMAHGIQRCTCGNCNGFHDNEREDSEPIQTKKIQRSEDNVAPATIDTPGKVQDTDIAFGGSFNLHGKTNAKFNKGEPYPEPFPDTVKVTEGKVGETKVFSAVGTFDVDYDVETKIELPGLPGGLSECQKEAVQKFIDGPLTAHEQDHESAYKTHYNGSKTISINYKNIQDTPEMRSNAIQKPSMDEHNTRHGKAVEESKKLDPWNEDIPGLDCEDKPKKDDSGGDESESE